jgi:hypothetical protein
MFKNFVFKLFYFTKFGFIPNTNNGDLWGVFDETEFGDRFTYCKNCFGDHTEFYKFMQEILSNDNLDQHSIQVLIVWEYYYIDIDSYKSQKVRDQFYYLKKKLKWS